MVKIPLLSFEKVYNFGNYLAISPPYSFQKSNLSKGYAFKCYVIGVGILSLIGELWSMWYRKKVLKNFRTSVKVSDVIDEVTLFGTYLMIKFDLCLRKKENWKDLFTLLNYLDRNVRNKGDKKSVAKFLTAQIVGGHLLFVLFGIYQWVSFFTITGITVDFAKTYVIHYFSYYNNVYVIILMTTILFTLGNKYETLNNNFEQRLKLNQKFLSFDSSNKKSLTVIREVEFFYRKLEDVVDMFNKLFGNVIFLELTNTVISVIVMINVSFLSSSLGPHNDNNRSKDVLLSNILATCFTMSWTVLFIFLCQRVINEAKNTINLCFLFQGEVPMKSDEREELLRLAMIAQAKIPVFTAAGFFEINRGTLVSIFGTVTTYVIVLIQINISIY